MEPLEQFQDLVRTTAPRVQRRIRGMVAEFKTTIDSARRCSMITNFEDLVGVLEKRLYVEADDPSTWSKLNEACERYGGEPFFKPPSRKLLPTDPVCRILLPSVFLYLLYYVGSLGGSSPPEQASIINAEVIDYLSSHISFSWRNFARGLNLTPFHIDRIEAKYKKNHSAIVREVLATYSKEMSWSSRSNGNVTEDILYALRPLPGHLTTQFVRLVNKK